MTHTCKICNKKTEKNWNYCPECGTRLISGSSKLDSSKVRLEKIKYHWERQHGGEVVYENFESVTEVGYSPIMKKIRPKLGDFVDINFLNLRLFSFLYYKPDYVNELMKAYKSYGYYAAYFTTKDSRTERHIGANIDDERLWSEFFNKNICKYYWGVVENTKTALVQEIRFNYKKKRLEVKIKESAASVLRLNKPLCFLEIASFCGPMEVFTNSYWVGKELGCSCMGDKECTVHIYPSKTEDFDDIPKFTSEDFKSLIDQSIDNITQKDNQKREKLGNFIYLFDDQLLNYYLVSLSLGHSILSKHSGCFVGEQITKKNNIANKEKVLEYLVNLFKNARVCLLGIKSNKDASITLNMTESVYSSGVKNIDIRLDIFIAGVIEGALKQATDQRWSVEETKCVAKGNEYCEFTCRV